MNDAIEIDNNNSSTIKLKRLSSLKKWVLPEFEDTRCNPLEVVLGPWVLHEHFELSYESANAWVKVLNGLWEDVVGALRKYEAPRSKKRLCLAKNKVMSEIMPSLSE